MRIVDKKQNKLTLESVDVQLFEEDLKRSPLMKGSKRCKTQINGISMLFIKLYEKIKFFQNRADPT